MFSTTLFTSTMQSLFQTSMVQEPLHAFPAQEPFHTSIVQEPLHAFPTQKPFPHFHSVETSPHFPGVVIFLSWDLITPCSFNPYFQNYSRLKFSPLNQNYSNHHVLNFLNIFISSCICLPNIFHSFHSFYPCFHSILHLHVHLGCLKIKIFPSV